MPAGRSFDAMGKMATVENAKSTNDWVDMKGTKPTIIDTTNNNDENSSSIAERRRQRRNNSGK